MVPDPQLRLDALTRALQDVVIPAIPAANKAAAEQASLVVASLALLGTQLPYLHAFEVAEVRSLMAMLQELAALLQADAPSFASDFDRSRWAELIRTIGHDTENPLTFTATLQAHGRCLREEIDRMVGLADGLSEEAFARTARAVIRFEKDHLARERAWVSATGFDVFPETLLPIAAVLRRNIEGDAQ